MIYASGFVGGGVIAGIRLGVLLEIAAIDMRMGFYAVQPFPGKLVIYGSVGRSDRDDHRRRYCRCDLQTFAFRESGFVVRWSAPGHLGVGR